MVTDLFHSFEDDLSQYTKDKFQSSLRSCDACPFENSVLLYEGFQSSSFSNFVGYKVVAILEKLKTHTTKQQCFHPRDFYKDMQIKKETIFQ
jgi:hypothetical protein